MKTRDHLKKAISRIVELEQKEVKNSERLNQVELKLAIVLSKLDQLENQLPEEEDNDSLDEKWEKSEKDDKAEKEDTQPEGSKPPGASSNNQSRTKLTDVIVQDHSGGRSGGHQGPDTEDNLEPDNQHGIRARVLDPSKVVHYRFDGKEKDYLQWSTLLMNYLESFGLWSYVSGERPRPPAPSDPEFTLRGVDETNYARYVHWKKRDTDCKNILQANVHKDILPLFTARNTSAEMWQVLKDKYQMKNPQSLANLKTAIEQCRMVKGQNLDLYIRNHKLLVNEHAAVGRPLSEVDRIVSFLSGLSDKYDTLKTLYMSAAGVSYKDVIIGLRSFEASKVKSTEKGSQAFSANKDLKPKKSKSDKKQRDPCSKCGFKSHATADCKVDLSTITCLRCEKKGHTVALCKVKLPADTPSSSLAAEEQGSVREEISFSATVDPLVSCVSITELPIQVEHGRVGQTASCIDYR